MRVREGRMARLKQAIDTLPIKRRAVDAAFTHFRETGWLPEEQRLADAVARRVLFGEAASQPLSPLEALILNVQVVSGHEQERLPTVREALFHQAVFETGVMRESARAAFVIHTANGHDPTDPQFLADKPPPDFAAVGMHLLGYPENLAKPPYVDQAHRLFERYAALRRRMDQSDPDWFEPIADAMLAFEMRGELPADELVREVVLADAEMEVLWAHSKGRDVAEVMALFDKVQWLDGQEGEEALRALCEMARAGRF